jgi:molybdenum cofactor cytidylyltransferase
MGSPKALLDFGGCAAATLVLRACAAAGCGPPVLVLGSEASGIHARLRIDPGEDQLAALGVRVVVNREWPSGRTSSLKAALRSIAGEAAGSLLVWPIDAPLVTAATIRRMRAMLGDAAGPLQGNPPQDEPRSEGGRIVIPVHAGRRGHPILCSRNLAGEILALADDEPVREVVRRDPARIVECGTDDPGVVENIDTPESYRKALSRWRG